MLIVITVISILAISALVWFANKVLPFTVCPICVGVFLTWVGLISAHFLGYKIALVIPALLMGGTVVGVMYKLEKKFSNLPIGKLFFWKVLFVPAGFVAAYGVLEQLWIVFFLAFVFLFLISLTLLFSHRETASDVEKKMKECC